MTEYVERDVAGATVVVTGGHQRDRTRDGAGIGRAGAQVVLLARDEAKAAGVVTELAKVAVTRPAVVVGDLSDLSSVRAAAGEIVDRWPTIDVLVNNAGMHAMTSGTSADGFDLMMSTNHLGPFLLTRLLTESLIGAGPARIVTTASEAHRFGFNLHPGSFGEPREYGPVGSMAAYGQSKLLNILFTRELARRLADDGVTANCFCPGIAATGLTGSSRLLSAVTSTASRTPLVARPDQAARLGCGSSSTRPSPGRQENSSRRRPAWRRCPRRCHVVPPTSGRRSGDGQKNSPSRGSVLVEPSAITGAPVSTAGRSCSRYPPGRGPHRRRTDRRGPDSRPALAAGRLRRWPARPPDPPG
ncbi:putative short-chaindehydrogenase/reductase [Gordonia araii NBRC 100433]|uniref:Putative short-chaindehydrogenase/reductase n=1 Tax=Gordonia araii NBRC 100433 TaxID=1073574 RepID=G7H1B3_9ACTN|nr:putative short-chaindehydrogenase/reductase [Gordonia araii NBRC 100433]